MDKESCKESLVNIFIKTCDGKAQEVQHAFVNLDKSIVYDMKDIAEILNTIHRKKNNIYQKVSDININYKMVEYYEYVEMGTMSGNVLNVKFDITVNDDNENLIWHGNRGRFDLCSIPDKLEMLRPKDKNIPYEKYRNSIRIKWNNAVEKMWNMYDEWDRKKTEDNLKAFNDAFDKPNGRKAKSELSEDSKKKIRRFAAKTFHPDNGGDPAAFRFLMNLTE